MGQWIFDQEILQITGEVIERERERERGRPILCHYTLHIKYSAHPHQNNTQLNPPSCSFAPPPPPILFFKSNTHTIRSI